MFIKDCIVCAQEFATENKREKMCSDNCKKFRRNQQVRLNNIALSIIRSSKRQEKPSTDIRKGSKVTVTQELEGKRSRCKRKATIVECYKHHALCQLRNYKESFSYENIKIR